MAQWAGQFTGRTHATRVDDEEHTLRSAIGLFAWCPEREKARREKAIRKMATRVLRARLKLMKAQLLRETSARHVERLRTARAAAEAGGVAAILMEFGLVTRRRSAIAVV